MNKQLTALRSLNFSYYATQAILLPFLPLYFVSKGYSSQEIGLFMMIGPFVAVFAQPIWGYVSDRFQSIKLVIFTLWALTVGSSIGLFYSEGFSTNFLFVLLLYFFMLPSTPLLDSITIKSTIKYGGSYGSVRLWGSIGFTTIAIVISFTFEALGGIQNIRFMYWALWLFPFLLLIPLHNEKSEGARISLQSLRSIVHNRSFLWFLLMVLFIMIPHRMNDALLVLYLQDLHANDSMISWAWALAAMSEIPTFALLSRYLHKYHELALLGIIALLYTIRWILYAYIQDPWTLIFLQASHSITFAAFWIIAVHYAIRLVPEQLRSTGQSLLSAVFLGLAGIIGGMVGGWIKDEWGGASMYGFGAILTFIAAILFFGTHIYGRKKDAL